MSSSFGWVDFAEQDRQQMLNVIKLFSEHETRDELGLVPFAMSLSRDSERLDGLYRTLVAYRMVFGQPRQEDLVKYLEDLMQGEVNSDELLKYRIDLSPASWWR